MTSMPSSQSADSGAMTQPPSTQSSGPPPQGSVIVIVVVIVIILLILMIVIGFVWWMYSKRRKQSHSFHEQSASRLEASSPSEHNSTFRVLSAWEEAMKSTDNSKTKDVESVSPYPSIHVSYCTPDLIAGTSQSEINQRNANDATVPEVTFSGADDRPRSSDFENPTFEMDLEGVLNNSLFNSPSSLDIQTISDQDRMLQIEKDNDTSSKRSSIGMDITPHFDAHNSDGPLESTKLDNGSDSSTHRDDVTETVEGDERSRDDIDDDTCISSDPTIENALVDDALISDSRRNGSSDAGIDNAGFELESDPAFDDTTNTEDAASSQELEVSR